VYLIGVHLIGVHLIPVYLIGVYLIGVHLISRYPGLASRSILELRSKGQEICYTKNSYIKIGGEIGGEIGGSEVRKKDEREIGRYGQTSSETVSNELGD
jgi:hypothetical protein